MILVTNRTMCQEYRGGGGQDTGQTPTQTCASEVLKSSIDQL